MRKIKKSALLSEKPVLKDFYNDMNQHSGEYAMRNEYVIELERNIGNRNTGRITIWKPQEIQNKYVPGDDGNKYYWVAVAGRKTDDYNPDNPETIANMDYHFNETLSHEYNGPRKELDFELVE